MSALLLDAGAESVLVEAGRVSAVGPAAASGRPHTPEGRTAEGRTARRLACDDATIGPGAVNAHTHLYSGLAPLGMPPPAVAPKSFVQILERVWWRLDRALDERALRAAANLYVAEALLGGTTVLVDHHESPSFIEGSLEVLADAAQELGIRLLCCYGATERNGGRAEAHAGLEECARFVRSNARPLVRGAVGLHASFTISDDTARDAGALARVLGVPVHVHVAEDAADVEDARRRGYDGPLERLISLEALPMGSILAHGVFLDAAQVRRADLAGLWIVQNPRSNASNRVGYPRALHASAHVALGTDGFPADMGAELEALVAAAAAHADRVGEAGCRRRAAGGLGLASALFAEPMGESLDVGRAADLVVRGRAGRGRPAEDGPSASALEPVRHVVVAGEVVVEEGVLLTGDLEAIRELARVEAEKLWTRMRALV